MSQLAGASSHITRTSAVLIDAQRRGHHRVNSFLLIVAGDTQAGEC
jgi:hypothetical protein